MGCLSCKRTKHKSQRRESDLRDDVEGIIRNPSEANSMSLRNRAELHDDDSSTSNAASNSSSSSNSSHEERDVVVLAERVQSGSSSSSTSIKNPHTFSRGTFMTISTFSEDSLVNHPSAMEGAASFTVPSQSTEMPDSPSLLSALNSAFQESPNLNHAHLLLKIGSAFRESGSSLLPQLSGMRGTNLLEMPVDFIEAPKFVSNVRALLIGVDSYAEVGFSRSNTVQDLRAFRNCLGSHGWPTNTKSMRVLTKDAKFTNCSPSYRNILKQLHWLVDGATADTALLFVFAGVCATVDNESALLPSNFSSTRLIRESMLYKELVTSLPDGANMTAIFDISSGGAGIQLPLEIRLTAGIQKQIDDSILQEESEDSDENPAYTPHL